MNGLPLHPALVHLPLGIAMILPLFALGIGLAIHRFDWLPRKSWLVVVGLLVLGLAGALASIETGEDEEERVEAVVPDSAIHLHEERAERLTWSLGIVLALSLGAQFVRQDRLARGLAAATFVGSLVVLGLAVLVGEAGGAIVHAHMVQPSLQGPHDGAVATGGHEEHDDD